MAKILLVDDNAELTDNVRQWLELEKHCVDCCNDGASGLAYLRSYEYDVVLIDWSMPKMTGIEVVKQFRSLGGKTPVLMLTGRNTLDDKEEGLDSGADDYLTKPFEMREVSARIRALLRRSQAQPSNQIKYADLTLDREAKLVTKGGRPVKMMPKDFAILELLMAHPNKVFSAETLIERLWDIDADTSPDLVRKHINRIREKIDSNAAPSFIRTVHGVGYAFDDSQH